MNMYSASCAFGAVASVFAVVAPAARGAVTYTVAARSFAPVPGLNGATYFSFAAPSINDAGVVAVGGQTGGTLPGEALFVGAPGDVRVVMRRGDAAPGTAGGQFQMPLAPTINDDGQVLFVGNLLTGIGDTTDANRQGLWIHTPGQPLQMIARNGAPIPGHGGLTFSGYNYVAMGDGGDVAFTSGAAPLMTNNAGGGVFVRPAGGSLAALAVSGAAAPGFSSTFSEFDGGGVNALGQVPFDARHNAPMTSAWVGQAGAPLTKLAHWGQPAAVPGYTYGQVFNTVAINSSGRVIFQGYLEGSGGPFPTVGSAVLSGPANNIQPVAHTGQNAPGTNAQFGIQLSTHPLISADNYITFDASLTGDGVTAGNDSGLWVGTAEGGFNLVAREGDVAPGTGGAMFGEFLNNSFLWIDEGGTGAFRMNLTGPGVTAANAGSLWSFDADGNLQLLARLGDSIEVAGAMRTLTGIVTNFTGNNDNGRATNLANNRFAFTGTFPGYHAVLIAHVPEPSATGLALIALGATLSRRTRRN